MLGRLLFLSFLCSTVLATFHTLDVPILPPENDETSFDPATKDCVDVTFQYCQTRFDEGLGISSTLDFYSGSAFAQAIYGKLSASIPDLLKVCLQRKNFYLCMRSMYDNCVSPFALLRKGATFQNVTDYVRVLAQLDFMCNGGFEEVVNQYSCLLTASAAPAYQKCDKAFTDSMTQNPSALCTNLNTYMTCSRKAFVDQCKSNAAGWWVCEDLRLSAGGLYCPDLRCQ